MHKHSLVNCRDGRTCFLYFNGFIVFFSSLLLDQTTTVYVIIWSVTEFIFWTVCCHLCDKTKTIEASLNKKARDFCENRKYWKNKKWYNGNRLCIYYTKTLERTVREKFKLKCKNKKIYKKNLTKNRKSYKKKILQKILNI